MRRIAPSSLQCAHSHVPENTEIVTNNNKVIVPHPPYSPDVAPCDFALFLKLKMKLKGRRYERVSNIQRESQAVLDSIKENYFHGTFQARKKTMGSLYTFPRRQAKLSKLSQHFFFVLVRELCNTPPGTFR
jgi:hypothetical protein